MPIATRIETAIKKLPHAPGVYLFKSAEGTPLYIGKAKDLRKRAASYLRLQQLTPAKARMVLNAHSVDHIVVSTEDEALLLENTLIKQHKPRYNVLLKDDKNFRYIRIDTREDYPRISTVRRIRDTHAHHYGPYVSGRSLTNMLKLIGRVFQVRDCTLKLDDKNPSSFLKRPCLKYDLGRCTAPCVPHKQYVQKEDYKEQVAQLESFLRGNTNTLIQDLSARMQDAAKKKQFEKAAKLRDKIQDIGKLIGTAQDVVNVPFKEADILALALNTKEIQDEHASNTATVARFVIRNNSLLARETYTVSQHGESPESIMEQFLLQFYSSATHVPRHLFVQHLPATKELLETWLSQRAGSLDLPHSLVEIRKPQRGAGRRLVALAHENAKEAQRTARTNEQTAQHALHRLQELFSLNGPPERIECVDVSHIQSSRPVASLVVFEDGKPAKDQYRKFSIRDESAAPDDTRRMQEVLRRRFTHTDWPLPDLLVVDGGKPQLGASMEVLQELQLEHIPLVALAKQQEELFLPNATEPIVLPFTDPALRLLTRARDEAHRFAITFHRARRSKAATKSALDSVPGIGPKTKKQLLQTFGSVQGIRDASDQDIESLIGPAKAEALRKHL